MIRPVFIFVFVLPFLAFSQNKGTIKVEKQNSDSTTLLPAFIERKNAIGVQGIYLVAGESRNENGPARGWGGLISYSRFTDSGIGPVGFLLHSEFNTGVLSWAPYKIPLERPTINEAYPKISLISYPFEVRVGVQRLHRFTRNWTITYGLVAAINATYNVEKAPQRRSPVNRFWTTTHIFGLRLSLNYNTTTLPLEVTWNLNSEGISYLGFKVQLYLARF